MIERSELVALWIIQYMHQNCPEMMPAMFERIVREIGAVNTDRDTGRALRLMLRVARESEYLSDADWNALMDVYGE